jgi:3-deoxy-D-manno-octulosonic-acid transferase
LWRLHRPAAGKKELRGRWRERRGRVEPAGADPLWIHAASVGEVNAIQALVNALLQSRPGDNKVLITTFTVSGAERVKALFGDQVEHRFAPIDTRASVRRWLATIKPGIALVAETEVWPELYTQAANRELPIVLVNARLSRLGLKRALRFQRLYARPMAAISLAICQSEQDARSFQLLGLAQDRTAVAGNMKFDTRLPADMGKRAQVLRSQWGARPAWVAGSTRPGEEAIALDAHQILLEKHPEALLVLAPRHPQRATEVRELIDKAGLRFQAIGETVDAESAVVLVDRLGQLLACYGAASATFVGGSLIDIGGHNLLEPAAFGKAVISGPYLHQQAEVAAALKNSGALVTVSDAGSLAAAINELWLEPERALKLGRAALGVMEDGRGAVRRTLRLLKPFLPGATTEPGDKTTSAKAG